MSDHESNPLANSSLRLNSVGNTRKSLAKVVRLYARGQLPEGRFRALCYGLSHLIAAFRLEKNIEIEERLAMIEETMEAAEEYKALRRAVG
jgi:hypothetical protein